MVRKQLFSTKYSTLISNDALEYCRLFGLYMDDYMTSEFIANNYVISSKVPGKLVGTKLFFNDKQRYNNQMIAYERLKLLLNM
jgi:hypothetical protein